MLSTVAKSAKASTMAQDGASQVSGNFHSSCESAIYVSDSKLHRGMEFKTVHDLHFCKYGAAAHWHYIWKGVRRGKPTSIKNSKCALAWYLQKSYTSLIIAVCFTDICWELV
jgi:hypothetical protein